MKEEQARQTTLEPADDSRPQRDADQGPVKQILARAKAAVGAEGAAKIRAILPALDERFDRKDSATHAAQGASSATRGN